MNSSFLETYNHLVNEKNQPNPKLIQGLWLIHGDEPLMSQWLIDALRPIWKHHQQTVKRIELVSVKTWQDVLVELDSLSLFDPASAIIVNGNHKPDKSTISALASFAERVAVHNKKNQNNIEIQHHLVWLTSKLDKKSFSAKWMVPFTQHGYVIDCHLHNEKQRLSVLQDQAQKFSLQLHQDAWQLLMSHTQNNLLNSYQTLWRLSYFFDERFNKTETNRINMTLNKIDFELLQEALISESRYNIYDLSDAMLAGQSQQVVKIIYGLQTMNEPATLVLWAVAKDMRLIQQLQSGKEANKIGIWRNKETLYYSAMHRLSTEKTQDWSSLLFKCDQSVKGVIKQPIWELLLQAALAVTGIKVFNN